MEQIRVVKEMRKKDADDGRAREFIRPRYMVWENVPGAFSSNRGKDFQAVLTEIVRIVEPNAPDVPLPDGGKWPKYGAIADELGGWSVAWRTHDAQYWGVPQRRRRICVLADFNGATAADILFDPKLRRKADSSKPDKTFRDSARQPKPKVQPISEGLLGNLEQGESAREGTSEGTEDCSGESGESHTRAISFQERAGKPGGGKGILIQDEHVGSMTSQNVQSVFAYGISPYCSNAMLSDNPHSGIYKAETSRTLDLNGGSPACNQGGLAIVFSLEGNGQRESHRGDGWKESDVSYTLNTTEQHGVYAHGVTAKGNGDCFLSEERHTTLSDGGGQAGQGYPCVYAVDCRNGVENKFVNGTLQAKDNGGTSLNLNNVVRMSVDVYNQTIGGVAPTVTASVGGTNTSGPKIIEWRKEEKNV